MNELSNFIVHMPIVTGVWLIVIALYINAKGGFLSKLIFKIIPFFLGLGTLYVGLVLKGVL